MSDLLTQTCLHCGAHWWANWFDAGDIRAQILEQFDGDEISIRLLDHLGAPQRIEQPMFWQLWISTVEQAALMDRSKPGRLRERSRHLFRRLLALQPSQG